MEEKLIRELQGGIRGRILRSEPLCNHTTYRVGGEAEILVQPQNGRDAGWAYAFARRQRLPLTVIGAGSNVIAPDEGIAGILLQMKSISPPVVFKRDGRVRADAGILINDFVRATAERGLTGLEPLAGIPGTLGGAIVMNAGTRDSDVSEHLASATVMTSSGRTRTFARAELSFGYRRSVFLGSDWLVLGAEFALSAGDPQRSARVMEEFLKDRERTYPLDLPSAGSVFRRPPGDYPGRLIEAAGCKGMRVGDAMVSDRHANFIVNVGFAKAADIIELISRVRKRVFETSGAYLDLEQIPLQPACR